jgi:hypothetical protein
MAKNISPTIWDTDIRACADIMSGFGAKGAKGHCFIGGWQGLDSVPVSQDEFSESIFTPLHLSNSDLYKRYFIGAK